MTLLVDAFRAAVRTVAARLLGWAARSTNWTPPPAPAPLRVVEFTGSPDGPFARAFMERVRRSRDVGPCADLGPTPVEDGRGFLCTRPAGHRGAHEARVDGARLDSWTDAS